MWQISRSLLLRIVVSAAMMLASVACAHDATFDQLLFDDYAAFGERTFEQLRSHEFEKVEASLSPSVASASTRSQLERIAEAFGKDPVRDVRVIGTSANTVNDHITYVGLTVEYRLPRRWLLATMTFHQIGATRTIDSLHVQETVDSQENLNRFTLSGKGPAHYAMLVLPVLVPAFILGTLFVLWKTPVPRRKWLWALFIAVGIGQFTFNWTTGQIAFQPQVGILGAACWKPGPYGPWLLSVSVPVGALVFLYRRRQWPLKRGAPSGQDS